MLRVIMGVRISILIKFQAIQYYGDSRFFEFYMKQKVLGGPVSLHALKVGN